MSEESLHHLAGWSAWASVVATLAGFVLLVLFFSAGEPFGTLNDASSALGFLLMVPVAVAIHRLLLASSPTLALVATSAGLAGMLAGALLQSLLVLGAVDFDQTLPGVLTAAFGIGVWLVLASVLGLRSGDLPARLAWLGILSGVGYLLLTPGFWLGGQASPLFIGGSLAALAGYVGWASWLGYLLLTGRLLGSLD